MHIPTSWAIALGTAAAMAVIVALAFAARRGVIAAPERVLTHVAYLLGGGLTGFMALAFPPAWPLLAAVVGMLVIRAIQMRRLLDVGMLTVGFGSAWALLFGSSIISVLTDPAVHSEDMTGWLVFAIGLVVAGLAVTVVSTVHTASS
jgi:hypothetical protein